MDISRIIWPEWLATKPQYTSPTVISTQEELRNAASANDSAVWLAGDITLTGQPLAVTGENVYVGMQPADEPTIMPRIIAPSGADRVLAIEGAKRVEFAHIVIDANNRDNPKMIAANVNRTSHLTFTHVLFGDYGRIGARFVGGNEYITFDECEADGDNANIYHGIGISNDGPNKFFVIYKSGLIRNGTRDGLEYGLDGHVDGLILADSYVSSNGRCIKLPSARNAWIYGNQFYDGEKNNLGAIWTYNVGDGVPQDIFIFGNDIYSDVAHLRYQHGAQVCWMNNRTYSQNGKLTDEKIVKGKGGGTVTRNDDRIDAFLNGQTEPPQPPPIEPPTGDNGDLPDAALDALADAVAARVLARIDYSAIALQAAELVEWPELPNMPDDLIGQAAELAVQKIALSLINITGPK